MRNLKLRLIVMNFLEFAVWGAYLTSMGRYLGDVGMGGDIGFFYSMQGIVSIFMPALLGTLADRKLGAVRTLALCQGIAGAAMLGAGLYAAGINAQAIASGVAVADLISFPLFFGLYTVSVAFYMPTISYDKGSYTLLFCDLRYYFEYGFLEETCCYRWH